MSAGGYDWPASKQFGPLEEEGIAALIAGFKRAGVSVKRDSGSGESKKFELVRLHSSKGSLPTGKDIHFHQIKLRSLISEQPTAPVILLALQYGLEKRPTHK